LKTVHGRRAISTTAPDRARVLPKLQILTVEHRAPKPASFIRGDKLFAITPVPKLAPLLGPWPNRIILRAGFNFGSQPQRRLPVLGHPCTKGRKMGFWSTTFAASH